MHAEQIAFAVEDACRQDVRAFKPGNVSVGAPGHNMHSEDFLRSAAAIGAPLSAAGATVGARIARAVAATRQVVSCNTNLGIVLLCAPLAVARERAGDATVTPAALQGVLGDVLQGLTVADADACYGAIRQASPGGLGTAPAHDVSSAPQVTLLAAMQAAAGHDRIAREYAEGYPLVFGTGVQTLQAMRDAGVPELWALTRTFLTLAAAVPDTHVQRKHGADCARDVQMQAAGLLAEWPLQAGLAHPWQALQALDRDWKARGINPGTTADLVVASALVMRLTFSEGYNGARHETRALEVCGNAVQSA